MRPYALIGLLSLAVQLSAGTPAPAPSSGRAVVAAMHARWQGRWYRTLAFSQHTRSIAPDGAETKGVWHEVLEHPGRLRIDFVPLETRSGLVCTTDRIHHFRNGKATVVQETWNHLLLLIGDVYCQPIARTTMQLEILGFDLDRMHTAAWNGRNCFVVGAHKGETSANQFWVDEETLLLQRVLHRDPKIPDAVPREVRIEEYRQVKGFPIAARIHFLREGRLFFSEDYFDIRVNEPLDSALFDPSSFSTVPMPLGPSSLRRSIGQD